MTVSILDEIVASKRQEVAAARRRLPLEELEAQAATAPPVRDFRAALEGPGPIQLIAEVKKASPSAKVIRADFDPVAIARIYQEHGAACLSILTDAPYFQGHLSYLARIRASVAIPLLRKDFLIDEYQVVEARLAGADAILLIAEILDDAALVGLRERASRLGMAALVEFHDPANLPRVLASGADLIGINNRDLTQFVTDLEQTLRLCDRIPADVVLVSESGIRTRGDVERLEAAGVSAILVGESLMRADDIGLAVEQLLGISG
jgi:indole-3-glycerol phosphate synthase